MKIAIVGGSIAGLAMAGELLKHGHEVIIYEQHPEALKNQGAGLVIPVDLFEQLEKQGVLNAMPAVGISKRSMVNTENARGKIICEQAFSARALHWQSLYTQLRANVPDSAIRTQRVTSIEEIRKNEHVDLIIGADGHNSFTAQSICDEIKTDYAGYIAWRGTVPLADCLTHGIFGSEENSNVPYFLYPAGHCVMYLISDPETNKTLINWVLYEKRTDESLKNILSMNSDTRQYRTLPRGHLQENQKVYLQALIKNLPRIAQNIIIRTNHPFIQPVYTIQVSQRINQEGNVVLMGDAGGTLPPHTASGATKALSDAMQIASAIKNNGLDGLRSWANSRFSEDQKLFGLASRMKDFLVLNSPDWNTMKAEKFEEIWAKVLAGEKWYTSEVNQPSFAKAKL